MSTDKMKTKLKGQSKTPLSNYIKPEGSIEPKTIRATEKLWVRMIKLSENYGISLNEAVVAAMSKVCDDENV